MFEKLSRFKTSRPEWGAGKMGEGGQELQTSSYEIEMSAGDVRFSKALTVLWCMFESC